MKFRVHAMGSAPLSAALVIWSMSAALAQVPTGTPAQAVSEARARLVCGTGTVVEAVYLPGGLLRATCRTQSRFPAPPDGLPAELSGTTLTTGVAVGAAVILLTVIVATGDGGNGTTTTTSGGQSGYEGE